MTRTYKYFRNFGAILRPIFIGDEIDYEWDGDEGYDFNYTPDEEDFMEALVDVVTNYFYGKKIRLHPELKKRLREKVEKLIYECEIEDALADAFEDELKEYFYEDAMDSEIND